MSRFLVTGAQGCIGAWTIKTLLDQGEQPVAFDLTADPTRLRLLVGEDDLRRVEFVTGDVTVLADVERVMDDQGITNVIHLAALQVPFCRADPPLGALVNVVGTVNVFEAAKRRADRVANVIYASSIGMYDVADAEGSSHRLLESAMAHPGTHYGVYKQANEGNAGVYWTDEGVASVGVRPFVVYGPGRDQGMTSSPTRAMAAAAIGRPYQIAYGGRSQLQYAGDVAATVIIASRAGIRGALTLNLGGAAADMAEVVAAIEAAAPDVRGLITYEDKHLPFPEEVEHKELRARLGDVPETPLAEGIEATIGLFRQLHRAGRLPSAAYA